MGTALVVPAETAALANGMAAHADETDDSHLGGRFHPGCGIVPAAFAVAEQQDRTGAELIRAVALGYDVGARLNMSLGYANPNNATGHSTHSLGAAFGAAAAAAALAAFRRRAGAARAVLCVPAGLGRAVLASRHRARGKGLRLRRHGRAQRGRRRHDGGGGLFRGRGCLFRPQQFLHRLRREAGAGVLAHELGSRFEIMAASIKKWCVGSPIQAVLDATAALIAEHQRARRRRAAHPHHHAGRPHAHRRQPLDARCLRAAHGRADARRRHAQLWQHPRPHAHARRGRAGGAPPHRTDPEQGAQQGRPSPAGHRRDRMQRRPASCATTPRPCAARPTIR